MFPMKKVFLLLPALFIAIYFFYFAGLGLRADFSHDDLMNMYRSLARSYPDLLVDNLAFWRFSPTYRPFGALIYKFSLDLFGLDLFPLRVFCYLVLLLNIFLLYALARRLSGSREIGLLAALLHAYHSNFGGLYFNSGTLYDIFCFTFTFAALLFYVRTRQSGRHLNPLHLAGYSFLLILALDSKEMALAVPIMIGFYELLYHPPDSLAPRAALQWLLRAAPGPVLSAGIAAAFYMGRLTSPADGLARNAAYTPAISLAEYLKQTGHYLDDLFYRTDWFTSPKTAVFLLVLLALAWLLRSPALKFSTLFFAVGILPMAFIEPRTLQAVYIPVAGIAMYAATLLVIVRDYLLGRAQHGKSAGKVFLFALVAYSLLRVHPGCGIQFEAWQDEYGRIRTVMNQWPRLHPSMKKEARILVVSDPFGEFNWASFFTACLVYRDPYLRVDRLPSMEKKPNAAEVASYDVRLGFENGKLRDLAPAEVPLEP
ncbi:MAG: hypothetical protein EHM65_02940 [Acidobacteriales bacterium]|nr:MAG: hypothetical protein EHM65_02940 [Terriglobales bacterium]